MIKDQKKRKLRPTAWLWWLSLIIAIAAGALIYFFKQDPSMIDTPQKISATLFAAATLIGICIISATSQWWLKR